SAMMHGYLPFDADGNLLTHFRTWRNTNTKEAAKELTKLFEYNIPLRWSVAHLYQAILNQEEHVKNVNFLTTLSGYVHWKLTGEKAIGNGDASGMFPVDPDIDNYDKSMMKQFDELTASYDYNWSLKDILPKIYSAGSCAGILTERGSKLLDPEGDLRSGIPFCPPEGDAGTGMVATNSITERTGNVSAGTSVFSMIVLDKPLTDYYAEIDIVNTPDGKPVAMVHCNNFTSDINDWSSLFAELIETMGMKVNMSNLFNILFEKAMEADDDVGKLINCNYNSGEPITGFDAGRPLFVRMPDSRLTLSNFMRTHIYSALATLELGMEILTINEKVHVDYILGHGGFFKTDKVGQQLMADALKIPITIMNTAEEGGPWGAELLAAYHLNHNKEEFLDDYLKKKVFNKVETKTLQPSAEGIQSFTSFMNNYKSMLEIERTAINILQ